MSREARRAFLLAYAAWVLGISAYFLPAATWNPVSRFNLTRAVVEQRTLSIDAFAESTGDRSLVNGRWYTDKTPLPSLLAVPAWAALRGWYALTGDEVEVRSIGTPRFPARRVTVNRAYQRALYVASLSTAGVAGAVAAIASFLIARRRGGVTGALVASGGAVLATPFLPYTTSLYGHALAGAALVGAVAALDPRRVPPSRYPDRWRVRLGGFCLALAPGCEYLTGVPAALVGALFLWETPKHRRLRALADLIVGGLMPILILAAYHTAVYGAPWRTGYSFIARPEFAAGHATGLLGVRLPTVEAFVGLTFGTRRGLFYLAPIALIALAGCVAAAVRRRDFAARAALLAFLSLLWLNASYYMWWGGAAAGPRHLVPALPGLAVGLAWWWRTVPRTRVVVLGVGVVSLVLVLAVTLVGLEASEFDDILRRYTFPRLARGEIARLPGASNLGLLLGLSGLSSVIPLVLWLVLGARYLRGLAQQSSVASRG